MIELERLEKHVFNFFFEILFKTIWVCDKVLSMLDSSERSVKFLPVLMELIVWGATDERVDDLLEKIVKTEKKTEWERMFTNAS